MNLLPAFASLVLLATLSAPLPAAEQDHATLTLDSAKPGVKPRQLELDEPGCGVSLELDRRQLSLRIQIDSLKTGVRFVYEADYAQRDPDMSVSIVVDGIQHFLVSPSDMLIMQAEQAEQGKGSLSTADIDKLYDRAEALEDAPNPVFTEMLFTIGGVPVADPWAGGPNSPVTDERVELKFGPVQTIPDGAPDTIVPVTFSFAGSCKVIRST